MDSTVHNVGLRFNGFIETDPEARDWYQAQVIEDTSK